MSTLLEAELKAPVPERLNGRVLAGWMSEQEGAQWLTGRELGRVPQPDDVARVRGAISAVSRRQPGVNQASLVTEIPASLRGHADALAANPQLASQIAAGSRVALADLSRVCALQPYVSTDRLAARLAAVDYSSLEAIAAVTMPLSSPTPMPVQFDASRSAWIASSSDPNLRVVANFHAPLEGGVPGFGFAISIQTSYVHVALVEGRYVLRDGYHRAVSLLSRGVAVVPVLFTEYPSVDALGLPPGLFSRDIWLGQRPPVLSDYHDNDVSCSVTLSATKKLVVIQALELTVPA